MYIENGIISDVDIILIINMINNNQIENECSYWITLSIWAVSVSLYNDFNTQDAFKDIIDLFIKMFYIIFWARVRQRGSFQSDLHSLE